MHIIAAEMERGMVCMRARQQVREHSEFSTTRLPTTPGSCCLLVPPLGPERKAVHPSRGEETEAKSSLHFKRHRQSQAALTFCPAEVKEHK